jgi:formylglycine-generating enzyme required for sulfatase activity
MQATSDSRPIHRVFVDGFWMDTTEVTNEQFAVRESDRLRHRCGEDATRRRLSMLLEEPAGAVVFTARSCRSTRQPFRWWST